MKMLRLLLKAVILVALILMRLGEIDWASYLEHLKPKYREPATYYVMSLTGLAMFLLLLDFIQYFVTGIYRRRKKIKGEDNFTTGIRHIYSILLVIGISIGILSLFRIEIQDAFTSVSIIFAGIAILTKDYISNMINGMIMTFAGQVSIGDNVRIGSHRGKIIDITLQNIHLLNDDDDVIYFPNVTTLTNQVINYTKREIKRTSIDFEIALRHLLNVEELEQILIETLSPYHEMITEDSYYLRVAEVKKDFVALKFQYILKEPNKDMERIIRRITVRRIVEIISEREKIVDKLPELPNISEAEGWGGG